MPEFDYTDYGPKYQNIPGFHGYQAGTDGSILRTASGKCLKGKIDKYGYRRVLLTVSGVKLHPTVHKLILLSFIGPKTSGMQCAHENGIRLDNRPCNLRWDTPKNNSADKERHGTIFRGEMQTNAKLKSWQVVEIRKRISLGHTHQKLADDFKVSQTTIHLIKHNKAWKCVGGA